jgi:hypothetical protein
MEELFKRSKLYFQLDEILKDSKEISNYSGEFNDIIVSISTFLRESVNSIKQNAKLNKRNLYLLKKKLENYLTNNNNLLSDKFVKIGKENLCILKDERVQNMYQYDEILRAKILKQAPDISNRKIVEHYKVDFDIIMSNFYPNLTRDDLIILAAKAISFDETDILHVNFVDLLTELYNIENDMEKIYTRDELLLLFKKLYTEETKNDFLITDSNLVELYNIPIEEILDKRRYSKSDEYYYLNELMKHLNYLDDDNSQIFIDNENLNVMIPVEDRNVNDNYDELLQYEHDFEDKREIEICRTIINNIFLHQHKSINSFFEFTGFVKDFRNEFNSFVEIENLDKKLAHKSLVLSDVLIGKWVSEQPWFNNYTDISDSRCEKMESMKCVLYVAGHMTLKLIGYVNDNEYSLEDSFAMAICLRFLMCSEKDPVFFFINLIKKIEKHLRCNKEINLDILLTDDLISDVNCVIHEAVRDQIMSLYPKLFKLNEYTKSIKEIYSFTYNERHVEEIEYEENPGDDIFCLNDEYQNVIKLSSWLLDENETSFDTIELDDLKNIDPFNKRLPVYNFNTIFSLSVMTIFMKLNSITEEKHKHACICSLMRTLLLNNPINGNIHIMEQLISGDIPTDIESQEMVYLKGYLYTYIPNDYVNNILSLTQTDITMNNITIMLTLINKSLFKNNSAKHILDLLNELVDNYQYILPFTCPTNSAGLIDHFSEYSVLEDDKVINKLQLKNKISLHNDYDDVNKIISLKSFLECAVELSYYPKHNLQIYDQNNSKSEIKEIKFISDIIRCLDSNEDDIFKLIKTCQITKNQIVKNVKHELDDIIDELKRIGGLDDVVNLLEKHVER